MDEVVFHGTSMSPGIGFGTACVLDVSHEIHHKSISDKSVLREKERLYRVVEDAKAQVGSHVKTAHHILDEDLTRILKAHEMMLEDEDFIQNVERRIVEEKKNLPWAIEEEVTALVGRFEAMRDPYLRARAEDIRDLGHILLEILSGEDEGKEKKEEPPEWRGNKILITRTLYPSVVMKAQEDGVIGFVTESPLLHSHSAILLKGLGIPLVGAVDNLCGNIGNGETVIVDALEGKVIARPKTATKKKYEELTISLESVSKTGGSRPIKITSMDGVHIKLLANIENPNQLPLVLRGRLEGVGLFRTEFMTLQNRSVPSEDEQYAVYRDCADTLGTLPLVVRTFDLGADKNISGLEQCGGMNPALGVRGLRRHILFDPSELHTQLRALLRASPGAGFGILFPMVTNLDEVETVKSVLKKIEEELKEKERASSARPRIGVMIETPAAAMIVEEILSRVDFISVGTNDLLQYFAAADRDNPYIISYYEPRSLSFKRLLSHIISEAKRIGRGEDVTLCGEMAGYPEYLPMLLRMGYRSFSISPANADIIRRTVGATTVNS